MQIYYRYYIQYNTRKYIVFNREKKEDWLEILKPPKREGGQFLDLFLPLIFKIWSLRSVELKNVNGYGGGGGTSNGVIPEKPY